MALFPSLSRYFARNASAAINRRAAGLIAATLTDAGAATGVTVDMSGPGWPSDVELTRDRDGFGVSYSPHCPPALALWLTRYVAAGLYWFAHCPPEVRRITVNLSDGDNPSLARFTASSRSEQQIAIPDPYFFRDRGFAKERAFAMSAPDWSSRSQTLTWRGSLSGIGKLDFDLGAIDNPLVLARLRLCLLCKGREGYDVLLSHIPGAFDRWTAIFQTEGLLGTPIEEATWTARKYAIDIDGFSNTWSNFLIRMLYGCCIFKVDSQLGFRQWYYDRLKPFEHYIPVHADMSDLFDKVDWARSHDAEARSIAENARNFAMALDFEAGKRDAIELITANWDKSGP